MQNCKPADRGGKRYRTPRRGRTRGARATEQRSPRHDGQPPERGPVTSDSSANTGPVTLRLQRAGQDARNGQSSGQGSDQGSGQSRGQSSGQGSGQSSGQSRGRCRGWHKRTGKPGPAHRTTPGHAGVQKTILTRHDALTLNSANYTEPVEVLTRDDTLTLVRYA